MDISNNGEEDDDDDEDPSQREKAIFSSLRSAGQKARYSLSLPARWCSLLLCSLRNRLNLNLNRSHNLNKCKIHHNRRLSLWWHRLRGLLHNKLPSHRATMNSASTSRHVAPRLLRHMTVAVQFRYIIVFYIFLSHTFVGRIANCGATKCDPHPLNATPSTIAIANHARAACCTPD